jgi:serine/threonine protein kinase
LVESNSPEWLVKIADFGISKRAREGDTELRSCVGTPGYAAPEVQGYFSSNSLLQPYTVSIDIWAVGVITFALLMKRLPFPSTSDFADYVSGTRPLDFVSVAGVRLSHHCQEFISGLLRANPAIRPTASSAVLHEWITEGTPPTNMEES